LAELTGKRVVIVGLGASGVAAARLCARRGARVVANDSKPYGEWSNAARALAALGVEPLAGGHPSDAFASADLVVVSPGVGPLDVLEVAQRRGVPIWGEVELAVRSMALSAPVIAIGGTNGKSTTTSLVGALLEAAGLRAFVGGNLGEPLADHVDEEFDAVVLEVSSFQMEHVDRFEPQVSVLLNVTDDHMDRYASFEAYADAKGNAFAKQTEQDWAVVPEGDAVCLKQAKRGAGRILTFGPGGTIDVTEDAIVDCRSDLRIPRDAIAVNGRHNAMNVGAALAAVSPFRVPDDVVRSVLRTFRGLPHRTALVAEIAGVRYYDDSKGTNVGASVTAVDGLAEARIVLIAGGRDKGGSYAPLVDALVRKGRAAVLIGEAAGAIARAIGDRIPVRRARSLLEAVRTSADLARPGDAVLLSPACSSFDMFRDYKHRGDEFVRAVHDLASERPS
jgi:UDP-N-acetylmuramoylalanine--D-glutamate ligase